MGLSSPLPVSLPAECRKAEKSFAAFAHNGQGLDKVIPLDILRRARGFVIFTVAKLGFVFSARAGSGLVIARLDDGSWSAPSALGSAGLGFGGQAGAELTEFVIVLNSKSAVKSFMSAGSVTLGGNMSVALGPLGRNAEGSGSLSTKGKVAAMYSYSRTKGAFGGISLESSVMVERQDANAKAYQSDVTAKQLLSGVVPVPEWAENLIATIERCAGAAVDPSDWIDDAPASPNGVRDRSYSFGSPNAALGSDGSNQQNSRPKATSRFSFGNRSRSNSKTDKPSPAFDDRYAPSSDNVSDLSDDDKSNAGVWASDAMKAPSTAWRRSNSSSRSNSPNSSPRQQTKSGNRSRSGTLSANMRSASPAIEEENPFESANERITNVLDLRHADDFPRNSIDSISDFDDDFHRPRPSSEFVFNGETIKQEKTNVSAVRDRSLSKSKSSPPPVLPKRPLGLVTALFDFESQEPGDLSFATGDIITILKKPAGSDWWMGSIDDRQGIFPSNYTSS